MILNQSFTIRDRKQAGLLLAGKLTSFRNSNAVVVGVPYGGAVVGYHIAQALNVTFDVVCCKSIYHPADPSRSIGSISPDQVLIHDDGHDIPGDYIDHQIMRSQHALKVQQTFYHSGSQEPLIIKSDEIILVGDMVRNADSLIASVRTLRSQMPKKIIVAAPIITPEAVCKLADEVDEIVSLVIEDVQAGGFYQENTIVRDEDIKDLLLRSTTN
jgi:predicted phosphoribosyltransferase